MKEFEIEDNDDKEGKSIIWREHDESISFPSIARSPNSIEINEGKSMINDNNNEYQTINNSMCRISKRIWSDQYFRKRR